MIYLDTNIFIYALTAENARAEECKKVIEEIARGDKKGCTSVLTWDEVIHVLTKEKGKEIAVQESKQFLMIPHLLFCKADREVIMMAQEIVEQYDLDPRDSIHAATALINGAQEIISNDSDFDRIKELKRIPLRK